MGRESRAGRAGGGGSRAPGIRLQVETGAVSPLRRSGDACGWAEMALLVGFSAPLPPQSGGQAHLEEGVATSDQGRNSVLSSTPVSSTAPGTEEKHSKYC